MAVFFTGRNTKKIRNIKPLFPLLFSSIPFQVVRNLNVKTHFRSFLLPDVVSTGDGEDNDTAVFSLSTMATGEIISSANNAKANLSHAFRKRAPVKGRFYAWARCSWPVGYKQMNEDLKQNSYKPIDKIAPFFCCRFSRNVRDKLSTARSDLAPDK